MVALPYREASQSGVLTLSNALGVRSVVYPTGGVQELATCVAREASVEALAHALDACLADQVPPKTEQRRAAALEALERAYSA